GTNQFNLTGDQRLVDKQVIQLGALENETRGGIARIKFGSVTPSALGSFTLSEDQILDSTFLTFGGVSALEATDIAAASAGFISENVDFVPQPLTKNDALLKKLGGVSDVLGKSAFENITSKMVDQYSSASPSAATQAKFQFGGAFAFSYTDHNVQTLITSTADLNSNDDMELTSNITEMLSLTAESDTAAQEGKKDDSGNPTPDTSAENSASVAIVVGVENNKARAIVEGGAHLDSMRALRLLSGVTYPMLTRLDEFVPLSAGELSDKIATEGFDAVNQYLDGLGGLTSLFNTWARSKSSADGISVAGSINVVTFNNVAESIVHSGAQINQDPFYRPSPDFYTNPDHDPTVDNDNITHSANANNVDEHVVSIEAINYMQFMNLTGVFGFTLPSISLGVPSPAGVVDIVGSVLKMRNKDFSDITESFEKPSLGAEAGKGGVGGAIFLQFLNNTTHAIVEPNVDLYSGKQSGLNIKAEEAILNLGFSQAGADSGNWAVGGTFALFNQDSDTLAQLSEGSRVNGGRVDVYAGSLETEINWAGGVAKGKSVGAGIAVAINSTDRSTRAIIGEAGDTAGTGSYGRIQLGTADDPADGLDGAQPINGTVTARASVAGGIYSFAVAGAVVNTTPDVTSSTANGKTSSKTDQSNTGIGIAGAAAVHIIRDVTQASLSDADVHAAAVDVKANNQNHIVAATGALAFAKASSSTSTESQTAAAVAGAFSDNEIDSTTIAFIRDSSITLLGVPLDNLVVETAKRKLSLTADDVGDIWTLSAGIGGALASGNQGANAVALTGSVSINTIKGGGTRARMIDSQVQFEAVAPDYLSTDTVATLLSGDTVGIVGGPGDGDVYEYVGTASLGSLPADAAAFKTSDWRLVKSDALIRATQDADI
ncbi:MAG: hypothetical protein ACRED3_13205, partial [Bradyrhizobium sp.]